MSASGSGAFSKDLGDLPYLKVERAASSDPTPQAEWSKKKLVWVPHGDEQGFLVGEITDWKNGETTVDLCEENSSPPKIKVVDFGLSDRQDKGFCDPFPPDSSTPKGYKLLKAAGMNQHCAACADFYSVGGILGELLAGGQRQIAQLHEHGP